MATHNNVHRNGHFTGFLAVLQPPPEKYLENAKAVFFTDQTLITGTKQYPVLKNFGQPLDMPTLPFIQTFNGLLFGWTL